MKDYIECKEGWNLISCECNAKIEKNIDIIDSTLYEFSNNKYKLINFDSELKPSKGYWIKCKNDINY